MAIVVSVTARGWEATLLKVHFAEVFDLLRTADVREEKLTLGGVEVRLVRIPPASVGKWDEHPTTSEIAQVWTGDFTVDFADHSVELRRGECCVVAKGVRHRGSSQFGAEVILFQQTA